MAKVVNTEKITDLLTSWENYTGQRVEELIKEYLNNHETSISNLDTKKFGFVAIIQAPDTKYYHLYFFANQQSYADWIDPSNEDPNKNNLVLGDIEIPLTNDTGIQDIVTLTRISESSIAVSKPIASATVLYKWEQYNPLNQATTLMDEDATITVSVRMQQGNGSWGAWDTNKEFTVPTVSGAEKVIDLSGILESDGLYQVRFIAVGENPSHNSSPVVMTILFSDITLEYKGDVSAAYIGDSFTLPFRISGNVERKLKIKINNYTKTYNLGTTPYTESLYPANCTIREFISTNLTRGVKNAEAWVTFGENDAYSTDHIKFQFIYVPNGDESTTPILAVSDVVEEFLNWSYNEVFKYGVYNPSSPTTDIQIRLVDRDTAETYIEQEVTCSNGQTYIFNENFAIEPSSSLNTHQILNCQFQFSSGGLSFGNNINVTIDNSENFSATSGATFVIQPDKKFIRTSNTSWEYEDLIETLVDTNSGWGFSQETDSSGAKVNVPILKVGAGNKLTIPYKVFDINTGLYRGGIEGSTTIEFDIRVSNIVADSEPVIDFSVPYADEYVGVKIYPTQVVCLDRNNNKPSLCDVGFQEDEREHIAINIIRDLRGEGINYVRIYMNGKCNREFVYTIPTEDSTPSTFATLIGETADNIVIGSPDADIDIFGVRIYKGVQLNSSQIQNDYMSSMPTINDKRLFKQFNSIYNGTAIEYQTCLNMGLNTILRKIPEGGHYPCFDDKGSQKGVEVEVRIFTEKGNPDSLDKAHSGNFYNMTIKGQGTSAKGYYWWNITDGFLDDEEIEESEYNSSDPTHYEKDGAYFKKLSYFKSYDCNELGAEGSQYYSSSYEIESASQSSLGEARKGITKLNGKANYASMQQSHKLGNIWLYDELWQKLVNTGTNGRPKLPGHACCYEKPFLAFYQIGSRTPEFCGFQTWGSAKGDKKTFGFDKKASPGYMCVSGADNGSALALYQIPIIVSQDPETELWSGNVSYQKVTINTGDEKNGYCYKDGSSNILSFEVEIANKYDGGETKTKWGDYVRGEDELKGDSETTFMTDFAKFTQFVCASSPLLKPWRGTIQELKDSSSDLDIDHQYWITSGDDKYRIFYYSPATKSFEEINFIPTFENSEDGRHTGLTTMTLSDQLSGINVSAETIEGFVSMPIMEALASTSDVNVQTEYLSQARVEFFKAHADSYIDVLDSIYHQCWVRLEAATDNRTKNTYPWIDGTIDHLVRWKQDDMDTVKNTDNQGQLTKPYHILEHTKDGSGKNYWNGENNVFFTLIERAYPERMRTMMKDMFTTMAQISGSVFQYFEDRFFWVQRYFPAVAYNETIRLLYEKAKVLFDQGGSHNYSQDPISQAIGDQLESEKEYVKKRLPMLMSWCEYEDFTEKGALGFRSVPRVEKRITEVEENGQITTVEEIVSVGTKVTYDIEYTAYQYIYPKMVAGGNIATLYYKESNTPGSQWIEYKDQTDRYRCKPGETVKFVLSTDFNTQFSLQWINYAKSLGNLGNLPCAEESSVTISGKRLRSLSISTPEGQNVNQFRPGGGINLSCRNLESLDLTGAPFSGQFNFELPRCKTIKLIDTKYTEITVPKSSALTRIEIPASTYSISIDSQPNLEQFVYPSDNTGLKNIQVLTIKGQHKLSGVTYNILNKLKTVGATPTSLTMHGIDWGTLSSGTNPELVDYLLTIGTTDIRGDIYFSRDTDMTYTRKNNYLIKWGNIDNPDNPLRIHYPFNDQKNNIYTINITGKRYLYTLGTQQFKMVPYLREGGKAVNGNNFIDITWSYSGYGDRYGENRIDPKTGLFTIGVVADTISEKNDGVITCTITKNDGSTVSNTYNIHLYYRDAQPGDYVFADGTYSELPEADKTTVGICFYVNPSNKSERLAVGTKNFGGQYWGMYPGDMTGTTLKEDSGVTDIFDLLNLPNISGSGVTTSTGAGNNYISNGTYLDENTVDGFKDYKGLFNDKYHKTAVGTNGKAASMIGFTEVSEDIRDNQYFPSRWAVRDERDGIWYVPKGTRVPWGYIQTLYIINHRNALLNNVITSEEPLSVGLNIPIKTDEVSEWNSLITCMVYVRDTYKASYQEIYYPAASKCYAYDPSANITGMVKLKDDEEFNEELFGLHNWFLPSIGDLARIYWYHCQGYTRDDEHPDAIYAQPSSDGLFDVFPSSGHWSSTEFSSTYSWHVNFSDGYIYAGTGNGGYKTSQFVVRPVVAF